MYHAITKQQDIKHNYVTNLGVQDAGTLNDSDICVLVAASHEKHFTGLNIRGIEIKQKKYPEYS